MNVGLFLKREVPELMVVSKEMLLQLESENGSVDTKSSTIMLHGVEIASYNAHLFDGKVLMTLPNAIQLIDPGIDQPMTKPDITLTDLNGTVKITMTHLYQKVMNDCKVFDYQNQIKQSLKKLNPSAEWLLGGVKELPGLQIPFFEFITKILGIEIYNLSFFLRLENRVLRGKFMCTDQLLKNWRPVFHQILESIEVKENLKNKTFGGYFFKKQQKCFPTVSQQ